MEFREGADNKVADALSRKDIFGITIVNNQHWLDRIRSLTAKLELPKGMRLNDGLFYKGERFTYLDTATSRLKSSRNITTARLVILDSRRRSRKLLATTSGKSLPTTPNDS